MKSRSEFPSTGVALRVGEGGSRTGRVDTRPQISWSGGSPGGKLACPCKQSSSHADKNIHMGIQVACNPCKSCNLQCVSSRLHLCLRQRLLKRLLRCPSCLAGMDVASHCSTVMDVNWLHHVGVICPVLLCHRQAIFPSTCSFRRRWVVSVQSMPRTKPFLKHMIFCTPGVPDSPHRSCGTKSLTSPELKLVRFPVSPSVLGSKCSACILRSWPFGQIKNGVGNLKVQTQFKAFHPVTVKKAPHSTQM